MRGYYSEKLSAERLRKVYDIAPQRVKQYLEAEIAFVLGHITATDRILELGCGYGRALNVMAAKAAFSVGIDTAHESLLLARVSTIRNSSPFWVAEMDAAALGFIDGIFDIVLCIQNGISAFHVDQRRLIEESLRLIRRGGKALFSSYSDKFWDDRLRWFELQAQHGLLGEIDYDATGDGVIVCTDGFRATTVSPERFQELTSGLEVEIEIEEVDRSSVFCVITSR
jgi:SAM-dependent methyltransferase